MHEDERAAQPASAEAAGLSEPGQEGPAAGALAPGLWLVATPIGAQRDITLRALDVLAAADVIAAEDTRRTRHLMEIHGIALGNRRLVAYHDRNGARARPGLLAALAAGRSVALVSDAGTPVVADPGYRLVREARAAGHPVRAVPGPSAVMAAMMVAGLPTDRFLFAGFLPPRQAARRRVLADLAAVPASLVFFEAPHRIAESLSDMASCLGDRPAALCRELTKRFEEVRSAGLAQLAAELADGAGLRGEIVLVVGPPLPAGPQDAAAIRAALAEALPGKSTRDAVEAVAARLGLPRRAVYRHAIATREGAGSED